MYTSFHIKASELDENFIKGVKALFKSKRILISVEEEMDETDYLNSTEANRKHLKASIDNVKKGKTTKVDLDKYLRK
jgi:antitoxin YefM